jgi:lipopolysaccharide transport system permease protein
MHMQSRIREIVAYRELLGTLVVRDLKLRYKNSVLGFLWSLVNPLLLMLVFTVVFTVMIPEMRVPNFPVFVLCAVLPWNLFSTAILSAIHAISSNGHLIKKVYFPLEVLPLSTVLSNGVNFSLAFAVLLGMIVAFRIPLTAALLWLPLVIVAHLLFTGGVAFILSTMNVFYRDTGVIMEVLIQAWFFLTPVFYPLEILPQSALVWGLELPVRRLVYVLNPMASIIASYRAILYGSTLGSPPHAPSLDFLARTLVTAALCFLFGLWFFGRYRERFAEEV